MTGASQFTERQQMTEKEEKPCNKQICVGGGKFSHGHSHGRGSAYPLMGQSASTWSQFYDILSTNFKYFKLSNRHSL